jgi:hypothetical protein
MVSIIKSTEIFYSYLAFDGSGELWEDTHGCLSPALPYPLLAAVVGFCVSS